MAGPWPFGETVTRVRRVPAVDGAGHIVRDDRGQPVYGTPAETEIKGCVVTPRQEPPQVGGQEQQARDTVITGYTVYAPSGTIFLTTDQLIVRGELCEITGQPGNWGRSPYTGTRGPVQVSADKVSG
jgi:hypothetical protein